MQKRLALILHIIALLLIFVSGVWAFIYFKISPAMQLYVVVVAVAAYIAWGMIYHFLSKRLTVELILEYILVGALVLLLYFWTMFT